VKGLKLTNSHKCVELHLTCAQHDISTFSTVVNMANNNSSTCPKDDKKNILFSVVEPIGRLFNNSDRSISPAPSKGSRGHSMGRKILSKLMTTSPSQSQLSLPLTFSTENPGGENCHPIVDSSSVTAPGGMPPDCSPLMDSSQYPDYRVPPALSGPHALATSPNTLRLTSDNLRQGHTSNSAGEENNPQSAKTNAESSMKENLKLTGRAVQALITRAADIVDTNPAKVALGLVKAVIEIKNVRYRFSHRILTDYYSRP